MTSVSGTVPTGELVSAIRKRRPSPVTSKGPGIRALLTRGKRARGGPSERSSSFSSTFCHHAPLPRKIEQLLAITPPRGNYAPLCRYPIPTCSVGEMGYVNLHLPGLVRGVGNPLAVGRECGGNRKLGRHQTRGLPISGKGKYPDRGL